MRFILLIVAVSALALAGCGRSSDVPEPPPLAYVMDATGKLQQRPPQLMVNNHDSAEKLRWKNWGEEKAEASGTVVRFNCKPNCAASKPERLEGTVRLAGLKRCQGKRRYTTLTVISDPGKRAETSQLTC